MCSVRYTERGGFSFVGQARDHQHHRRQAAPMSRPPVPTAKISSHDPAVAEEV
jgi:hypothetical protein